MLSENGTLFTMDKVRSFWAYFPLRRKQKQQVDRLRCKTCQAKDPKDPFQMKSEVKDPLQMEIISLSKISLVKSVWLPSQLAVWKPDRCFTGRWNLHNPRNSFKCLSFLKETIKYYTYIIIMELFRNHLRTHPSLLWPFHISPHTKETSVLFFVIDWEKSTGQKYSLTYNMANQYSNTSLLYTVNDL